MLNSKQTIAAGLITVTALGTTLAVPAEADAHPLLAIGIAAGAAVGILAEAAIAHPAPVVVERVNGPRCVVKERIGPWGRVRNMEVCR